MGIKILLESVEIFFWGGRGVDKFVGGRVEVFSVGVEIFFGKGWGYFRGVVFLKVLLEEE